MAVTLFGVCCCGSNDHPAVTPGDEPDKPVIGPQKPDENNKLTSMLTVNMSTDKALYNPGETVSFKSDIVTDNTTVRYRHLSEVVKEEAMTSDSWTWQAPADDFKGYLVELVQKTDGGECIVGTIAVDVSSDWKRFPRYGFVAAFGQNKTAEVTEKEMEELNRYHINGVQFQDWHYKHHWPLGGTPDNVLDVYTDIANRSTYTSSIRNYIAAQHKRGMKSIFYNLCFGVLEDAQEDGVSPDWYIIKEDGSYDFHGLPSSWKSDIYLVNPGNPEWQAYMNDKIDDVYEVLDFDGYQIDQLGNRGDRYTMDKKKLNLPDGYASFINAVYERHPEKSHIMNAVSNYGLKEIASTGKVDFAYNELWGGEDKFHHLLETVSRNDAACKGLQTVFAAYMNYGLSGSEGYFNDPGVILTDAVMHAIGGSHLELGGDHMLGNEYFPNSNLKMKGTLKTAMIRYYDFITAYENLLRGDNGKENDPAVTSSSKAGMKAWTLSKPLQTGNIVTYSKLYPDTQVVHLLNMVRADSDSWRDLNGTMPTPSVLTSIEMSVEYAGTAEKVWAATPDYHGGAVQELAFTQENGKVAFTVPNLKYWTMIVIE